MSVTTENENEVDVESGAAEGGYLEIEGPPPASHTMPTQSELEAQARMSPRLIAVHRQGHAACEAREVEDGFAYRPYGSADGTLWQWQRTGDFNAQYEVLRPFRGDVLADVTNAYKARLTWYKTACRVMYSAMGKKSIRRLETANFPMQAVLNDK